MHADCLFGMSMQVGRASVIASHTHAPALFVQDRDSLLICTDREHAELRDRGLGGGNVAILAAAVLARCCRPHPLADPAASLEEVFARRRVLGAHA